MADANIGMTQEEYRELKAGLLDIFRQNVSLASLNYESHHSMNIAQAATALVRLEEFQKLHGLEHK